MIPKLLPDLMTSTITFEFQLLSLQITGIECGVGNDADTAVLQQPSRPHHHTKAIAGTLTATAGPHTGSY